MGGTREALASTRKHAGKTVAVAMAAGRKKKRRGKLWGKGYRDLATKREAEHKQATDTHVATRNEGNKRSKQVHACSKAWTNRRMDQQNKNAQNTKIDKTNGREKT